MMDQYSKFHCPFLQRHRWSIPVKANPNVRTAQTVATIGTCHMQSNQMGLVDRKAEPQRIINSPSQTYLSQFTKVWQDMRQQLKSSATHVYFAYWCIDMAGPVRDFGSLKEKFIATDPLMVSSQPVPIWIFLSGWTVLSAHTFGDAALGLSSEKVFKA